MTSWWKGDHVPIWWPPRMDELYKKDDPWRIKIASAVGGWIAFVICYGGAIFIWILLMRLLMSVD